MIKFVFKQSNLNLNGPIRSRHIVTAHRLQGRAISRALPNGRYRSDRLQHERYGPALSGLKPYHPLTPPRRLIPAVPPSLRATAIETSLMLLMYQQAVCHDKDKRMVLCPLLWCYRGSLFIALLFSFILYCQTIAKKLTIRLAKNQIRA
jgi:hypothetical protein